MLINDFAQILYRWSEDNPRPMPWRAEKDPYKVWISEVMLQQTQVEQVIDYYHRFLDVFPTVHVLAKAPEQQVLKLWEGLGYNSRARNLHAAAQYVSEHLKGKFPDTPEGLMLLKGIGPYASAAIASFAFNYPAAVIDTNVIRIWARLLGTLEPIDHPGVRIQIQTCVHTHFDEAHPAKFNQAIMDFGALQCTPKHPQCEQCPFNRVCKAFQEKTVHVIPVKPPKRERKTIFFNYAVIIEDQQLYIAQRTQSDIWQGLWEFPHIETLTHLDPATLLPGQVLDTETGSYKLLEISPLFSQILTHRSVKARFYILEYITKTKHTIGGVLVSPTEIKKNYPISGIMRDFLITFDLRVRQQCAHKESSKHFSTRKQDNYD